MVSGTATTFADPGRETAFRRDGYAVMPVLSPAEVAETLDFYWSEVAQPDDFGLCIDHMRDDRGPMQVISERLGPLWERVVRDLFVDHRAVFCTFVVKHPGVESQMGLHEDQTWVDERRFRSGTLWIPLTDVGPTTRNGALGVVPGSHRLGISPCGAGSPFLTAPYERGLSELVVVPEMTAGTGLFYDSRTLHGSSANERDTPRVALACGIVPKGADLLYVRATGRRARSLYAVDDRFYLDYSPRQVVAAVPDGYEVVEEYEDDAGLTPELVGEILGLGRPVDRVPVVPWSVHPSADPMPHLPTGTGGHGAARDIDPGTPSGTPDLPGWHIEVQAGDVGAVADPVRRTLEPELGIGPGSTLVVVSPWSRCSLVPLDGAAPLGLEVVDSARVSTGVAVGPAATNFEPGDVVELAGAEAAHVWNEGPMPLTLLLAPRTVAAPRRRLRDLLRK